MPGKNTMKIGSIAFHITNIMSLSFITALMTFLLLFIYYLTYEPKNPLQEVEELLGNKNQYIIVQNTIKISDLANLSVRDKARMTTYFQTDKITQFLIKDKSTSKIIMKVFSVSSGGFAGAVHSLVATDGQKIIAQRVIDASTETAGLGRRITETRFQEQFDGKQLKDLPENRTDWEINGLDMISGATFSSMAVVNNLKKSIDLFKVQGGQNE